ncbi:MAG: histidinol dehydrogenase [Clostridia bacterium]|nr:histidinol dehydrogenase [Clostridia bacterium]
MIRVIDFNQKDGMIQKLIDRDDIVSSEYMQAVEKIIQDVKQKGDSALLAYTQEFDGVKMDVEQLKVTQDEMEEAYRKIDDDLLESIRKARDNIFKFHQMQKRQSWFKTDDEGIMLGQKITSIAKAGVYVPGGKAAYPSSVLMNVMPAKVAGVKKIIMVTPPQPDGTIYHNTLVAAKEAGVDEIFKIGGAQAIAALAYGTQTITKVDKITGPGNIYVALAKRCVYGTVDIDMIAGPSEILVIADRTCVPEFVAADLLSQAEHDPLAACIMITDSETVAQKVKQSINQQARKLEKKDIIEKSLQNYSAIICVDNLAQAVDLANNIAPEHLEICVENPFEMMTRIDNAGAIFLGNYSAEPVGDYFAGPNHVLPTGGTARFFSPLGVDDFIKKSSIIYYSQQALNQASRDIMIFARSEGLTAHENSIKVRLTEDE